MAQIKWNLPAFEQIRRLPGVERELSQEVSRVLDSVGREHFAGGVEPGRSRSRGYVVTTTVEGIKRNAREHVLLRALGNGRAM